MIRIEKVITEAKDLRLPHILPDRGVRCVCNNCNPYDSEGGYIKCQDCVFLIDNYNALYEQHR